MRTVRDFVKDMAMRGRTDVQIRAVAACTNWHNQLEEVMEWCRKRGDRWRSRYVPPRKIFIVKRKKNVVFCDFS